MQLKEMSYRDVIGRGVKKTIIEITSVKFWGAVFLAWLNAHIILADHKADAFLLFAFLALLGIREATDYLDKKVKT